MYMWPFELMLAICLFKMIVYVALMQRQRSKKSGISPPGAPMPRPTVDILLPMFNEEKVVAKTIENLLGIKYDKFSIIVVDDGSTDNSYALVQKQFGNHPQVRLLRQPNEGKSAALNKAMGQSRSEIVVSIDADTWVKPDAIAQIVGYFRDEAVGAVAGHIKVGNRVNWLTDMQYYEYVAIWDNDRAFSDTVNGILIVPGALGAYRRSAVNAVGGFKSEVIAEDTELTLRLLYNNYIIRNAADAVAYTEAPDNLRMFFRQRVRWTTGLTQGLVKHNRRLFAHSRWLAWLILPFTWLFRIVLPLLLPFLDFYLLYVCFALKRYDALFWWLPMLLAEAGINRFLLAKNRERVSFLKLLVLQRMYRHLLYCNYWFIFAKWLNGTMFRWGKITRKGNIRLDTEVSVLSQQPESK